MASFADEIADIARPRSMEFIAGMAEGNEFGANAKRLARLITHCEDTLRELNRDRPMFDWCRGKLRAAIEEASR